MSARRPALRLPTAPIWVQILALVIGALIVAQLVTLALTILLPPAPPPQHSLTEIAQALRGGPLATKTGRPLIRRLEKAPPSLNSPGWLVSQQTTRDLAGLLKVPESDVRLLFYAPPPVAGAPGPPPSAAMASPPSVLYAGYIPIAAEGGPAMTGMGPGRIDPGSSGPSRVERMDRWPERSPVDMRGRRETIERRSAPADRTFPRPGALRPEVAAPPTRATIERPRITSGPGSSPGPGRFDVVRPPVRLAPRTPLEAAIFAPREIVISPGPAVQPAEPERRAQSAPTAEPVPREPTRIILTPPPQAQAPAVEPPAAAVSEPPLPARPAPSAVAPERSLPQPAAPSVFGFARAPYVEGEFVAALKTSEGWVTVKPEPEGFPNSWQRRVLIWFGLSFGLVAPIGYLLARRLAAPLGSFAAAAERLGREPAADLAPLAGPAEVGRAARAFNLMQQRLKRYVEDRTGMVGAISHDLRTPLARMRFKLERAPPALRAALSRDISQMEEMITSVLSFMRDESAAVQRDSVDLRSILECVVDDAGGGAALLPGPPVAVTVDVLGMQRVFENLVDNALKYGTAAHVTLSVEDGEAVVEVTDNGPGLAPEDLERVFKPFYRSPEAKTSGKAGMGLGLAVSRSTVRAHGGDLILRAGDEGLVAQVRLPAAASVAIAA